MPAFASSDPPQQAPGGPVEPCAVGRGFEGSEGIAARSLSGLVPQAQGGWTRQALRRAPVGRANALVRTRRTRSPAGAATILPASSGRRWNWLPKVPAADCFQNCKERREGSECACRLLAAENWTPTGSVQSP